MRADVASPTPFRPAWTVATTKLPVYFPAPEQGRAEAVASMQNSMMGWGEIALRQAQASKEARERRRAAHDNIEVDGGSKRDKTAASRRINTEIREKYSVERLKFGERIQIASPAGAGKTTF